MPKEYSTWVSELAGTIEDASTITNIVNTNVNTEVQDSIVKAYKQRVFDTVNKRWNKLYDHSPINKDEAEIFVKMYLINLLNMCDGTEFDKFSDIKIYNKLKELYEEIYYY